MPRCHSCCSFLCISCAATYHADHYVTDDNSSGPCEESACSPFLDSTGDGGTDFDVAAAPVIAGISLLMLSSDDSSPDFIGDALAAVTDEEGLVSLEHLQAIWRSRLPRTNPGAPSPPPQHAVLRSALRSGLLSTSRVSGIRAKVGLQHPRAHEVAALAALPAHSLRTHGVDIGPIVKGCALHEYILTVLSLAHGGVLWDPRDVAPRETLRKSVFSSLRLPSKSTVPNSTGQSSAALSSAFSSGSPFAASQGALSSYVPRAPISAPVSFSGRTCDTARSVPDLVRLVKLLLSRADSSASNYPVSITVSGNSAQPESIVITSAHEVIVVDLVSMAQDTISRQLSQGRKTDTESPPASPPLLVLLHPLLPLCLDPRITKIVSSGSFEVSFLSLAGIRIVNLFVLRVALEELGLPRSCMPSTDAELLAELAKNGGPAMIADADATGLAMGIFVTACVASDALFASFDLQSSSSGELKSAIDKIVVTKNCPVQKFSPPNLNLFRAELRSQLEALAPANLVSSSVGSKRGRFAREAQPVQPIPPWWHICRTCNARGEHFNYDCAMVDFS
jgi:hypothetical protein